jgi:DNA invertase Pin-like site-specific DNA recombinase
MGTISYPLCLAAVDLPKHQSPCNNRIWHVGLEPVKIGYMRESAAGPSLAEEQALLRLAGIEDFSRHAPVYTDRRRKGPTATTPERDNMVRILRPGDVVIIAKATRLGTSRADVLKAMADITARGVAIHDAEA